MNIFDFFFRCFSYIINILNHDFFGFGFTYLDFILSCSLVFLILRFLLQGFNETDRFNFLSLSSCFRDFSREYQMKNNERETQIINSVYHNTSTGKIVLRNTKRDKFPDGHLSIYTKDTLVKPGNSK